MGMSRSDAATYVASSFSQLLTDAGMGNDDEAGELKEVIDDALLMTGAGYDDLATATVASGDILGFRAVLKYTALLRIADARGDRASSISLDGPNQSKSWNRDAFQKRIDAAKVAADPYIVSGQWGAGTFVMGDWIEPYPVVN